MAKGPCTVLRFPDDVADHWDLPALDALTPLEGGYHNEVYRAGDLVIRRERKAPEGVAWEHELVRWLAEAVPEVVAPLTARDGTTFLSTPRGVVSVLPFVEGSTRGGVEAAELLARIHRRGAVWPRARPRPGRPSYAALDWERNDWWDWHAVPKPPELVRAYEHTRAWIASVAGLVVTPVHGDTARQNVLWRGERIAGIVDWEWARLDWPAVELSHAVWALGEEEPDAFARAYADADGPGELHALGEGRRILLLTNALYALTRRDTNSDRVRYLLGELQELA